MRVHDMENPGWVLMAILGTATMVAAAYLLGRRHQAQEPTSAVLMDQARRISELIQVVHDLAGAIQALRDEVAVCAGIIEGGLHRRRGR